MKNSDRKHITENILWAVSSLLSVLFFLGLSFFLASTKAGSTPAELTRKLFTAYNHNIIPALDIHGVNILTYIYASFVAATALILSLRYALNKIMPINTTVTKKQLIVFSMASFFILTTFLQTANATYYLRARMIALSGKTLQEKQEIIFGFPFKFADFCKNKLPGKHKAALITDMPMERSTGLMLKERLTYHFYPIDIAGISERNEDCAVIICGKLPVVEKTLQNKYPKIHVYGKYFMLATNEASND